MLVTRVRLPACALAGLEHATIGPDPWHSIVVPWVGAKCGCTKPANAHAGSRARITSMGGLYDAATLHAPLMENRAAGDDGSDPEPMKSVLRWGGGMLLDK